MPRVLDLPDAILVEIVLSAPLFRLSVYGAASATCRRMRVVLQAQANGAWQLLALSRFPRLQQLVAAYHMAQPDYLSLFKTQLQAETAATYDRMPAEVTTSLNDFMFTFELARDTHVIASWTGNLTEAMLEADGGVHMWDEQSVPVDLPPVPPDELGAPYDICFTEWKDFCVRVTVSRLVSGHLQSVLLISVSGSGGWIFNHEGLYWDGDWLPVKNQGLLWGWTKTMLNDDAADEHAMPRFKPELHVRTGRLCNCFRSVFDPEVNMSPDQVLFYLEHCVQWPP